MFDFNGSGWFPYQGVTTSQNPNVEYYFEEFLKEIKPSRVIEIGTFCGGLTLMLRHVLDRLNSGAVIYTYDPEKTPDIFKNGDIEGIVFSTKNMFNYPYNDLDDFSITELIKQDGITLVLCDGGSKKNEFKILAPYLKSGDIIMAHDYAPDRGYFEENMKDKIWNWFEIQDSDIKAVSDINNLKTFWQDHFINVAWCCRRKI